ncbi:BMP family ABC transporter substrate-binding protein [Bacillus suaedae]|uniref:BMP family ABC transporter substrate-binding protein n=1 Tax=Halalkalibacter suaedae TaxID=2822140 RepID=A0A940WXZ0_9BACI|nr:BMP family ABC transporter substrate-binding protein [Bacillus suaedae]MBP3950421.1 BMP family ABC transporter substrate-binding protein [Bacillus suaedae]
MQQSKQLRIIIWITGIVVTVFLIILFFSVSGIMKDAKVTSEIEETNVVIITSDVIADQSWGSLAYKGQLKIQEQFPIAVELFSEIDTTNKTQLEKIVDDAVNSGTDVIIGHGREFSDLFIEIAPSYQEVHFVTVHGWLKHSNQAVYTFDHAELEYFASLAASLKTKTNKIGIIDVHESNENPEFEQALKYYSEESEIYYRYVEDRDDSQGALKQLDELIELGVDVVYPKGNAFNRDVIDAAKKEGIYVIGYVDDQSYMAPNYVLTSVLNDVTEIYVSIIEDYFSEEGIPSGKVMLTEEDGVYMLAPFGPMFSDSEVEFIENEILKFEKGELRF